MSTNILSSYQELIRSNPLLTREQEIELSKRIKKGDLIARQKMIETGDFGPWDLITESGL